MLNEMQKVIVIDAFEGKRVTEYDVMVGCFKDSQSQLVVKLFKALFDRLVSYQAVLNKYADKKRINKYLVGGKQFVV